MLDRLIEGCSPGSKKLYQKTTNFCKTHLAPLANKIDQQDFFPKALWPILGNSQLLGITVPALAGGLGCTYQDHVIVMAIISSYCPAVGLSYGAHTNLCLNQIARYGNAEQKSIFLPELISGNKVGALAITEPEAGSDAMGMSLSATLDGEYFVLNGKKCWITNGSDADTMVVFAKTQNSSSNKDNLSALIFDTKTPGFEVVKIAKKMGMRGSNTAELQFNQCRVHRSQLLGTLHQGTHILMDGLNAERVILAGGPIGIMLGCIDTVLPYVRSRKQFGKSIGHFQLMQAKIADMYTSLTAAHAHVLNMASKLDKQQLSREDAASAILFASEQATQVALSAVQALGGNGYSQDYPVERFLRDAKLYEIGGGTSEIRRMLIGRQLINNKLAH